MFSNFGIGNSYYASKGEKVNVLLGRGDREREAELEGYEFYSLIFEEQ